VSAALREWAAAAAAAASRAAPEGWAAARERELYGLLLEEAARWPGGAAPDPAAEDWAANLRERRRLEAHQRGRLGAGLPRWGPTAEAAVHASGERRLRDLAGLEPGLKAVMLRRLRDRGAAEAGMLEGTVE
jgi:hypothetical protein